MSGDETLNYSLSDELSTGKTRTTEPFSASLKTNVKLQLKTEKLANPAVSR